MIGAKERKPTGGVKSDTPAAHPIAAITWKDSAWIYPLLRVHMMEGLAGRVSSEESDEPDEVEMELAVSETVSATGDIAVDKIPREWTTLSR